jgi:alpha-L-rhamnosidase
MQVIRGLWAAFFKTARISLLILLLFTLFVTTVRLTAQQAPSAKWTASWITHPTAPLREPIVLHFKKSFMVSDVPSRFVVRVSADNRFVLFLNGERIGDGPARGDLAHWRYETFDLATHLRSGENTLTAIVWNFGIYSPVAQMSNRTAFLVNGETQAESSVDTNDSWLVEVDKGHAILPRKANGFYQYMAVGPGEMLDAKLYDWNWQTSTDTAGDFVHAGPAIRESVYPSASIASSRFESSDGGWELVPDTLPHTSYTPESAGVVVRTDLAAADRFPQSAVVVPAHSHVRILLDRKVLTTAYPRLTLSGGRDAHIALTYSEALYDKTQHKGNRDEVGDRQAIGTNDLIIADGGDHRVFETLWWRTWRYLDLDIETADQPLTLENLEARFTAYPFTVVAQFASSDPELKRIWDIGWRTTQLDAHETYMDTPFYEQLQYVGDTRIEALTTYAVTGDDRLARQAIRAFNSSRIPEGITQSRYPSSIPQYIPPFSLLWIGMVHDYWMNRPDAKFVKENLAGTRTVLDWFELYQQPSGLLRRTPWWNFVDWVNAKDDFPSFDGQGQSCLMTLQYIGALKQAGDLENAFGTKDRAIQYQRILQKASEGVMRECWDSGRKLVADSPAKNAYSQQANALAVLYDVVPQADQSAVLRSILAKEFGIPESEPGLIEASYYFRFYLARALDHAQMGDLYLQFLKPWRELLPMGFSTWPETAGDTRSDSHAWTAHPTYDLLAIVGGIQPAEPGFKTIRIAPHLDALALVDITYPHPMGNVHVHYEQTNNTFTATIDLPPGLSGEFQWRSTKIALHSGHNEVRASE